MIWLPTPELLLQLLAVLLCFTVGVCIFRMAIILVSYVVYDKSPTESDRDWIWLTKWWLTILVIVILIQKFFRDNNIPLEMFPWIKSSEYTCRDCKS